MTAPMPNDPRLFARPVLDLIAADGGVIVLIAYSDGSVSLSSDDDVPPAMVSDVLRSAADVTEQHPDSNQ